MVRRTLSLISSLVIIVLSILQPHSQPIASQQTPAVMLSVIADHSHVTPNTIVKFVFKLSVTTGMTGTAQVDVTFPEQLHLNNIDNLLRGTRCTIQDQSASCQADATQGGVFFVAETRAVSSSTQLVTVEGFAYLGSYRVTGSDSIVIQGTVAPTQAPYPSPTVEQATSTVVSSPQGSSTTAPASVTPSATATQTPTATAPASVTPSATATQTPTATAPASVTPSATATQTPTATAPPASWLPDALENNYDLSHAAPISLGVIPNLNFVAPGNDYHNDVDYIRWFAKAGRCYTLATTNVDPALDPNIELVDAQGSVLGGNDDALPTSTASSLTWCVDHDQPLFARIAQNTNVPLNDPRGKTYQLALSVVESSPTTEATSTTSIPTPATVPTNTIIDSPTVEIDRPASIPTLAPELPDYGSTTPQPFACIVSGDPQAVVDTSLYAGVEPCPERSLPIEIITIPVASAHVVASDNATTALRAGPGHAYVTLAWLPRGYHVQIVGRMYQGYVEVTVYRSGSAPLQGWIWGADLIIDRIGEDIHGEDMPTVATPTVATPPVVPVITPTTGPAIPNTTPQTSIPQINQGSPLNFRVLTPQRQAYVIQVCTGSGVCSADTGVRNVLITFQSAAGDVIDRGFSDSTGRWTTNHVPQTGAVFRLPWYGLEQNAPSASSTATTPIIVRFSLPTVIIPPTFGGTAQ